MKIIYFNETLNDYIRKILKDGDIEIDYEWPIYTAENDKVDLLDKIKFKLDDLFGRNAVVGEITPGFIPLLVDGLNLIVDLSIGYFVGISSAKLYDIYKVAEVGIKENYKDNMECEECVLKIITDDYIHVFIGETKKSISFVLKDSLTQEQFLNAVSQIPKIREKIYNLLGIVDMENINRIECLYSGDSWEIYFIDKLKDLTVAKLGEIIFYGIVVVAVVFTIVSLF